MRRAVLGVCGGVLAAAVLAAAPVGAILPAAIMGKEILQNFIFGEVKGHLIGSLSDMGCKGSRLAGLIASATAGAGPGGGMMPPGMAGGMGLPNGMGVPNGMTMPNGMGMPGGSNMPGGMGMPGGAAMGGAMGGSGSAAGHGIPTASPEQMSQMMATGMPDPAMMAGMSGMSPEQAAQMQQAMAGIQEAMQHPLSRSETVAVFDQLHDMGVLPDDVRDQVRECIALAPPGAGQSIGTTGALFKTMVLPQLQDMKKQMDALTPEEQAQLEDGMVGALKEASPKDRDAFLKGFGEGFYPASVVQAVRSRMGVR
jgi:hypothetical protein